MPTPSEPQPQPPQQGTTAELAERLESLAAQFRTQWPKWLHFLEMLHARQFPEWHYLDGNIWTASHDTIARYINARDPAGKPLHPRSFNDESADFAGREDYARVDKELTEYYQRMGRPYPELEKEVFSALARLEREGDAASRQQARKVEDLLTELQGAVSSHFSSVFRQACDPSRVAQDIADCLELTARALRKAPPAGTTARPDSGLDGRGVYQAQVVKVMIASPGDVLEERELIREAIADWNSSHAEQEKTVLVPVMWETDATPEMGDRPQEIINRQLLRNCALLVAVFWTRLGTPTGKAPGGTVEEIQEHIQAGKPVMIYFSQRPSTPHDLDRAQYESLETFRRECEKNGLIAYYDTPDSLKGKLRRNLVGIVRRRFPRGAVPNVANTSPPGSPPETQP